MCAAPVTLAGLNPPDVRLAKAVRATVNGRTLSKSMLGMVQGVGPKFTNSHTTGQWVADHEGVLRALEVGEIGYKGGRRVRNLQSFSNKFDADNYDVTSVVDVEELDDGWRFTTDGTGYFVMNCGLIEDVYENEKYIVSFFARNFQGNISSSNSYFHQYDSGSSYLGTIDFKAGWAQAASQSGWVRYSGSVTVAQVGCAKAQLVLRLNGATEISSVEFKNLMIENSTGRVDSDIPSEYIPTGVATSAEDGIPSNTFAYWDDPTYPNDWYKVGTHNASNYVEQASPGIRVVSDGTYVAINKTNTLQAGRQYIVEYEYSSKSGNGLRMTLGGQYVNLTAEVGVRTKAISSITTSAVQVLSISSGAMDCTLSYLSVRPVDHGFGIDGVRWLNYANGTTVDGSGVVTDARGADLDMTGGGMVHTEAVTNFCHYSDEINGNWNAGGTTGVTPNAGEHIDGSTTATLISGSTAGDAITLQVAVTASAEHNVSCFVEGNTSSRDIFGLFDIDAGAWMCEVYVDWTAGVPSLTNINGATNLKVENARGNIYRISMNGTKGTGINARFYYYPDQNSPSGDSVYVHGFQATEGGYIKPFVPTSGAATSITANDLQSPDIAGYVLEERGTIEIIFTAGELTDSSAHVGMVVFDSGSVYGVMVSNIGRIVINTGGGEFLEWTTAITPGTEYHIVWTYGYGTQELYVNGALRDSTTYDGTFFTTPIEIVINRNNNRMLYLRDIGIETDKINSNEALLRSAA